MFYVVFTELIYKETSKKRLGCVGGGEGGGGRSVGEEGEAEEESADNK